MRVETEVTPDHLEEGNQFRWEPDGNLWTVLETRSAALVAVPWHPDDWPEAPARAPVLYQFHPDRTVWMVTPDG